MTRGIEVLDAIRVTGGTPSLPKYLLAAALEKAGKQLGIK
jgi:hypothetical protein